MAQSKKVKISIEVNKITKFTPGPWSIFGRTIVFNDEKIKDCDLWPNQYNDQHELAANLHLIAAAPDMFEFIASLENDNNQIPDWLWKKRNEIIKKVTK